MVLHSVTHYHHPFMIFIPCVPGSKWHKSSRILFKKNFSDSNAEATKTLTSLFLIGQLQSRTVYPMNKQMGPIYTLCCCFLVIFDNFITHYVRSR